MLLNAGLNAWISDMDGLEVSHGRPYLAKYFAHGQSADICLKVGKAYKIRLRKSRDNHRPMCIQASSRLVMQGGPRDGVSLGTCYLDEKNLTEMHGTALSLNNRSQLGSIKMAQHLYGGYILVVVREATIDDGFLTKTTLARGTTPMASFRFWISESANNSTCTQRPAQKNPLRQSSVIRSAPSGFKNRETITNSRRTRRIENHDAGSESDEEYDNRKRRYSGHGADTTVVHNRPSDRSEYGTRRRSKSHQRSTAKRQRTQITNAITSNPRACQIFNALAPADLHIKDVIGMMGESDSDEFSDTTVSVSRSVTGQTLAEAAAELRHWKILAEKAEVNALRKKVNQVKAEIQYYKKKVRDITERLNV